VSTVICVCTYKRPEGIQLLLNALTQLSDIQGIRICVVDNDAAGEGAAVCNNLPPNYPFEVHALVEPQAGISPARNSVVASALTLKPDFLAFLDDDEQPEPQWLSELLRVQKVTGADVVGGPTISEFPENVPDQIKQNPYYGADLGFADEQSCQLQAAGNFLIKADVISTMAPTFFHPAFAQSGGEDLAFFTQLAKNGASMHWAANAIVREAVPANRLTQSWMKSRVVNIANSRVRVMQMLEPGLFPAIIRGVKTVALGTVAGLSSLTAVAIPDKREQARMLRWKFWGKMSVGKNERTPAYSHDPWRGTLMPARPRYSIVIPTYNSANSIEQTLHSCFEQSFKDFEIVIVDDGSNDATLDVLAQINDSRLVVVSQENAGPAAARNHGMRVACGDYIAFLDSDDIWFPDFLMQAEAALSRDANQLLYGQIIVDRGVGRYWVKPDVAIQSNESIYDYLYLKGCFIQTSTMIIPATLASQVSWDESVTFGDNDQFAIDCFRTGIKFTMLEKPQTLYADSISADALSQLPIFDGTSEKYTNFFRWMQTQREHMSEQAWHGFRARFESVGLARSAPIKSFKLLLAARKAQAISTIGLCRQLVQNYAPKMYRRLVDQYVRLRGAPLNSFDS